MSVDSVTAKALFEEFVGLWNGTVSFAEAEKFIDEEIVVHSGELAPYLGLPPSSAVRTRERLFEWVGNVRALLQDLTFTTDPGPICEGDLVAGGYLAEAAYGGGAPLATVPVGTKLQYRGHSILRLYEGRFVEYWVLSDGLSVVSQLGAR